MNMKLTVWKSNEKSFSKTLSCNYENTPAVTRAPMEQVYSHGGIIMCLHIARLNTKTLSKLIFFKSNCSV